LNRLSPTSRREAASIAQAAGDSTGAVGVVDSVGANPTEASRLVMTLTGVGGALSGSAAACISTALVVGADVVAADVRVGAGAVLAAATVCAAAAAVMALAGRSSVVAVTDDASCVGSAAGSVRTEGAGRPESRRDGCPAAATVSLVWAGCSEAIGASGSGSPVAGSGSSGVVDASGSVGVVEFSSADSVVSVSVVASLTVVEVCARIGGGESSVDAVSDVLDDAPVNRPDVVLGEEESREAVMDAASGDEPEPGDGDVESEDELVLVSAGAASATPGLLATAAPIPRATANAPTRPMYFALPITLPPARLPVGDG
jgi:hypothetical protein